MRLGPAGLITRGSVTTYFVGVRCSVATIISSAASLRTSENATWTPSGASFGELPPPMSTEPSRSAPPGGTRPLSGRAADKSIGRICLLVHSTTLGEHSSTAGLPYGPKNTRLPSGNGVARPSCSVSGEISGSLGTPHVRHDSCLPRLPMIQRWPPEKNSRWWPSWLNTGVLASVIDLGRLIRWITTGSNGGAGAAAAAPANTSEKPTTADTSRSRILIAIAPGAGGSRGRGVGDAGVDAGGVATPSGARPGRR